MDGDIDLVADCFARVGVGAGDVAELRGVERGSEARGWHAEHGIYVVLECREAFRHLFDALCPLAAGAFSSMSMPTPCEYIGMASRNGPPSSVQTGGRYLTGQIPERDIDAADGGDVRHVGVHQRRQVVEVNLDGQRILADEQALMVSMRARAIGPVEPASP